jgi:hypothetical protein
MPSGVTVHLAGEQEARATNVNVQMGDRGLWVEESDGTWTFRPWFVIDRITGFKKPV